MFRVLKPSLFNVNNAEQNWPSSAAYTEGQRTFGTAAAGADREFSREVGLGTGREGSALFGEEFNEPPTIP